MSNDWRDVLCSKSNATPSSCNTKPPGEAAMSSACLRKDIRLGGGLKDS
eukprot:CAMPEP_0183525540 /NCGR_PEP_ID=MMETSP0371-20130417/20720_1 /TAXON_ID=268820 /ORGANISM="Peridinium aciculiferum, Strain PAER-2" /LENGTH=48 /DNA_ID= /DNA_START= /DNA_END= /DNA_ORIENTATION=